MARTEQRVRRHGSKRKRDEGNNDAPAAKKHETTRPEQTTCDEAVSMMDPSLLADHFAKALKKHSGDSSTIELEDKYIPSRSIRDTTTFSESHVAKHLPAFLEQFSGGKDELCKGDTAKPHTLIITPSGIRAADIAREVRVFAQDKIKVAKLFAKHMKFDESVSFVEKNKINIVVGTPKRPTELIDKGALKLVNLKRIVIDGSYVDEKKRTIFDMAEVFLPLVTLLNLDEINEKLRADKDAIEILVF